MHLTARKLLTVLGSFYSKAKRTLFVRPLLAIMAYLVTLLWGTHHTKFPQFLPFPLDVVIWYSNCSEVSEVSVEQKKSGQCTETAERACTAVHISQSLSSLVVLHRGTLSLLLCHYRRTGSRCQQLTSHPAKKELTFATLQAKYQFWRQA